MRFNIEQKALQAALGVVTRVTNARSTLPVLGNVYISADSSGVVTFAATNLEIMLIHEATATVQEAGALTLPAKTFADLVGQSPDTAVWLTTQPDASARYMCANIDATIKGIDAEEFPSIPDVRAYKPTERVALRPADTLARALTRVVFAAATDNSRPILTGVLFQLAGGVLTLAAADGFRLSRERVEVATDHTTTAIVPARALAELARLAANVEEVQIITTAQQAVFVCGDDTVLVAQLIEGNFPDVARLIPAYDGGHTSITADTAPLRKAVRRAYIFARDAANIIRLQASEGALVLSAEANGVGGNEEELPVHVAGIDTHVALNAAYLLDALNHIGSARVTLQMKDANRPVLLVDPDDSRYEHVVMPMHIGKER